MIFICFGGGVLFITSHEKMANGEFANQLQNQSKEAMGGAEFLRPPITGPVHLYLYYTCFAVSRQIFTPNFFIWTFDLI